MQKNYKINELNKTKRFKRPPSGKDLGLNSLVFLPYTTALP